LKRAARDRVTTNAASLAFHWFLALVPGAIALTGLAGLAGLREARVHQIAHGITVLLPSAAAKVLAGALTSHSSSSSQLTAALLGGGVSLWASLEAAVALQFALDMVYETNGDRSFVARRMRALALIAITLVFGGGAFLLLIVGSPLGSLIAPRAASWFMPLWTVARWIVGVICVVVLISLYDFLGPNRTESRWRLLSIGGVTSTVLWLAVAEVYSFYLNHFGHSTDTYGNLAGVVLLEVWLFLSALAVLVGAEVNAEVLEAMTPRGAKRQTRTRA
jgi:membrane protein